ncbi:MAG: FAD/NAD(P)-binding oxidoreductase [Actinomycetes bacterium]
MATSNKPVDVAVIGSGPAGMAAAVVAGESGASVLLIDASGRAGGQFYRRPTNPLVPVAGRSLHKWALFDDLEVRAENLSRHGMLTTMRSTMVWSAEGTGPFQIQTRTNSRPPERLETVVATTLVIATGAFDRHLPFPGWELPGVMSCGAVQALVKGSGVLPGQRILVAGTGPILLAVAATVLEAGGSVAAVVEANSPERLLVRAHRLTGALDKSPDLARYIALLARHRVPYLRRHRVIAAQGKGQLDFVEVAKVDRDWHQTSEDSRVITCDVLAIGFGFTASTELLVQLNAEMCVSGDGGLAVNVDSHQGTSVVGVFACGETTGVGGADLALAEGMIAGASAAQKLGLASRLGRRELEVAKRRVRRLRNVADAFSSTFATHNGWTDQVGDNTTICRCEEVRAGTIRNAVDHLGAVDVRSVKLTTRAGMGWCQGRVCSYAINLMCSRKAVPTPEGQRDALLAAERRPMTAPVTLGTLAQHFAPGVEPPDC